MALPDSFKYRNDTLKAIHDISVLIDKKIDALVAWHDAERTRKDWGRFDYADNFDEGDEASDPKRLEINSLIRKMLLGLARLDKDDTEFAVRELS